MWSVRKVVSSLTVSVGLQFVPAVLAVVGSENPYHDIVTRNSFSLLPPEAPKPVEAPKPPTNVKLTGITTMMGSKRALLLVQEPGPGAKEQSVILREGQREGDVEVLEIDEKEGMVKINNGGVASTLSFDKDGMKLPSLPAAVMPGQPTNMPPPGVPQNLMGGMGGGLPGQTPTTTAIPQPRPPGGGLRQIPTRTLRLPPNASNPGAPAPAPMPTITPNPENQAGAPNTIEIPPPQEGQ